VILYEFLNTKEQRLVPRTSCNKQIEKIQFVNQQFVKSVSQLLCYNLFILQSEIPVTLEPGMMVVGNFGDIEE